MLLLAFPLFQENPAVVMERLEMANVVTEMVELWHQLAQQKIEPIGEDEDF